MSSASYLPLAQVPIYGSRSNLASFAASRVLRRRGALAGLLLVSLLVLFSLLRYTLRDYDVEDLDLLPPGADLLAYLPFELSEWNTSSLGRLRPVHGLPASCLDTYFALGEPCYHEGVEPLDMLWTWVNGSDPLLQQAKTRVEDLLRQNRPESRPMTASSQLRLYRDHDELRHSFRSVLQHFRAYTKRFVLFTADFPAPRTYHLYGNYTNSTSSAINDTVNVNATGHSTTLEAVNVTAIPEAPPLRLGQIPQWLDLDHRDSGWKDGAVELSVVHHAQVFNPYNGTNFNSLAIESQLTHLNDISENFIYMNDDLFMMNPMTHTSFYTSVYGLVLHLQSNLLVPPSKPHPRTQGEWKSMGLTNEMLGMRFGVRHRPYVVHEAKTASVPLLHEMAQMWPEQFATTAAHPFRETQGGDGDVNTMFLHTHFIVERAREALLWSWVVARNGGRDDEWGEREASVAWSELGGTPEGEGISIQSEYRDTLEPARIEKFLKTSGHTEGGQTRYVFSSLDGYPYTTLGSTGASRWPSMARDTASMELPRCRISYAQCFKLEGPENSTSTASEIFKNLAFRNPRCGDCVVTALVRASGTVGLSAFLPAPERELSQMSTPYEAEHVAHLPVVADWQVGDFSLQAVMHSAWTSNVRDWTLQLLQRYRYVIGDTPSLFERVTSPKQALAVFERVDKNRDIALLCLNDDIAVERINSQVTAIMRDWQEKQWTHRASWEKR